MGAEMLLQYLWEHRLWEQCDMSTTDGERIRVIDPGLRNDGSGPDFFNAKIEIGGRMWAGNVEVHVRASDWYRHRHQHDPAYDTVILHVTGTDDAGVCRRDGRPIPQLVLPYTPEYRSRYESMVNDMTSALPCAESIGTIPAIYITDWIGSLGYERLYEKADRVADYNRRLDGDWLSTAYVTMARALGFGTNAEPMERLALATPLRPLLKHRDDPAIVEAMLLGQAGFLDVDPSRLEPDDAEYLERRRHDYAFMCAKYGIARPQSPGWKTGRLRPANSPMRRLAALAAMVADGFELGRQFSHLTSSAEARRLLEVTLRGYWVNHHGFGHRSAYAPVAFSDDTISRLIINAVVPLIYSFGLAQARKDCCDVAIAMLEGERAESNSVVSLFTGAGITCRDAFTSQALIQLRRAYCEPRKCLYCRIGHRILASRARPNPL